MEDRDDPILREILHRAAEMPPSQRATFLDDQCADNPALRAEVDALLSALDDAADFLTTSTSAIGSNNGKEDRAVLWRDQSLDCVGTHIDGYKLLQQIGEGGMAIVYLAEQETPVRRRVALKVIKPGMDSAAVITRFEAERQALAMMDHPNIARVFAAGTTSAGRPYFAMEFVEGIPITQYCDSRKMTPRQRLELFIPVCQAIQHAHQKGIIHRDIKPTNVLVTLQDNKPVPKVIDFGVAKALNQNLTEDTIYTQVGSFVGTLEYMSPEQAETDILGIDTRTDVYSMGVLLYELLTGTTPHDGKQLRQAGYQQKLRTIREDQPQKPSTRLSSSGEAIISLSALRQIEPKKLTRLVTGDLDWIVMKCIEKDRTRRYETADGLSRDIERYLNNLPVEASPPSAIYRVRKLVARHRVSVALVTLLLASLSAGLIVSTIALARANRAEGIAKTEQEHAKTEQHRAQTAAAMMRLQEGTAFVSMGKLAQADTQFELAHAELTRLGGDAWIADLGLWDLSRQTNPPIAEWPLGTRRVMGTKFLPDGKSAVVLQDDGTLLLIEMPLGKIVRRQKIPAICQTLRLTKDGKKACIGTVDGSLYEWAIDDKPPTRVVAGLGHLMDIDSTGGQTLHQVAGGAAIRHADGRVVLYPFAGALQTAGFIDDERFITAGTEGVNLKFWHVNQRTPLFTVNVECALSNAASPDAAQIAVAVPNDSIQIYNTSNGSLIRTLSGHSGRVSEIQWSPDQKLIFTSSWDGSARVWDAQTGRVQRIFRGSTQPLNSITLSNDGFRVMAGGWDGTPRLWDIRRVPAAIEFRCAEHSYWGKDFTLLCDNKVLAVSEAASELELYDRATGIRLGTLGPDSKSSGSHRGATQTELIYGAFDGTDVVYDLESQKITGHLGTRQDGMQTYSWRAANAPVALIWRRPQELTAWNLKTRKPIRTLASEGTTWQVDISPDGQFAMAFGNNPLQGLLLYPINSAVSRSRESTGGVGNGGASTFTSDGEFLLTRRFQIEAFASVWRTRDLTLDRTIPDGNSVYSSDRFWPDDQHLLSVTQSRDQVLRDAQSGEVLYTLSNVGDLFAHPTRNWWVLDRGFDHRAMIADLTWPARRRELFAPVQQAMQDLSSKNEDAQSLLTSGRWYSLHGADDWAIDMLTRARKLGATVSSEDLATCYARIGNSEAAVAEYEHALQSATSASQRAHLRLCLEHFRTR